MKVRYVSLTVAALAVLAAGSVSADGVCCPMPKKPLRAEGAHVMHRPLLADGLHHLKKPLRADGMTPIRKPLLASEHMPPKRPNVQLADGSGNPIPCCRRPLVA